MAAVDAAVVAVEPLAGVQIGDRTGGVVEAGDDVQIHDFGHRSTPNVCTGRRAAERAG
ncbi:hypothetical protein ACW9HM_05030 [Nocardia gipuzkoensis]